MLTGTPIYKDAHGLIGQTMLLPCGGLFKSLYCKAIQSLKYHHILMLTGTPIYNGFSNLFGQTMLLPGGGLFNSLEHFRSVFCPVDEFNPQGVWRDLYRRLYRVLIMAHLKKVIDILSIRVVSREVKLTDRITILRIDTLMVKFNSLLNIGRHCKYGSARKNMFIEAMVVLSQEKQLSACPLLLGPMHHGPKKGKIETQQFSASVSQILASWHPEAAIEGMAELEFGSFRQHFLETRRKGIQNGE
jgi:hypothetical protein